MILTPALILIAIILAVVIIAVICAKITGRKSNDNGLIYEYQNQANYRKIR